MIVHHYIILWETEPYVHWLPPPHRMRDAAPIQKYKPTDE